MNKKTSKRIIAGALFVLLADIALGGLFLSSRALSHLAAWNIVESDRKRDFYWPPDQAPAYFRFESVDGELWDLQNEARSITEGAPDDLRAVLALGRHVRDLGSGGQAQNVRVKWDSPQGMLQQMQRGSSGNCFHRSVILSSYISALGIPSRLWALENDMFEGVAHTVNEVYVPSMKKWVFLDVLFGFYAIDSKDNVPLSFLEFRERLLDTGAAPFFLHGLNGDIIDREAPAFYRKLVTCAFLRGRNDFTGQYHTRYGPLFVFRQYLDKLPNSLRIGLGYFLSARDVFVHYEDRFSPSLEFKILKAKMLFYLFIFWSTGLAVAAVLFLVREVFLRRRSRKETRHK